METEENILYLGKGQTIIIKDQFGTELARVTNGESKEQLFDKIALPPKSYWNDHTLSEKSIKGDKDE